MKKITVLFFIIGLLFILSTCKTTPKAENKTSPDLQAKYDQLDNDYNNLQKRENDLMANIQGLKKTIDDQSAQITALKKQIDDLKKANSDLASANAKKSDLDAKVVSLTKERDNLSAQLAQLQAQLSSDNQKIQQETQRMADTKRGLEMQLGDLINSGDAKVYQYAGVIVISINDTLLFDPDSPVLKPTFYKTLDKLAAVFKNVPDKMIRVEGHTADDVPTKWASTWELGAMRSVSVVRYLQDKAGIDPMRIVAVSMGRYRPIAPNDKEENRKKNRRVEIQLIDRQLWEIQELQQVSLP